jgi:hypothetical protein
VAGCPGEPLTDQQGGNPGGNDPFFSTAKNLLYFQKKVEAAQKHSETAMATIWQYCMNSKIISKNRLRLFSTGNNNKK